MSEASFVCNSLFSHLLMGNRALLLRSPETLEPSSTERPLRVIGHSCDQRSEQDWRRTAPQGQIMETDNKRYIDIHPTTERELITGDQVLIGNSWMDIYWSSPKVFVVGGTSIERYIKWGCKFRREEKPFKYVRIDPAVWTSRDKPSGPWIHVPDSAINAQTAGKRLRFTIDEVIN